MKAKKGKKPAKKIIPPENRPLTRREREFADQYIISRNGRQSAIKAGFSERSAEVTASRLLRKANIKPYIDSRINKIFDDLKITQERVLREYARIGFSDIRRFFNEDGSLKALNDLDDDAAAALSSVETDENFEYIDGVKVPNGVTRKIKIWDKKAALDSICRMKGWNAPDKKDITTNGESLNQPLDLSGLTDEELRLLAKIKRKMNVERI